MIERLSAEEHMIVVQRSKVFHPGKDRPAAVPRPRPFPQQWKDLARRRLWTSPGVRAL